MKANTLVAEICLYGNHEIGAGWLANTGTDLLGDGEPFQDRTFTSAIWSALEAIREARPDLNKRGNVVAIYTPGGTNRVLVDLSQHVPSFGQLAWIPMCDHVEISADEIEREAQ